MRKITLWICDEDGENREFIVDNCKQYIAANSNRMLRCNIVAETHAREDDENEL